MRVAFDSYSLEYKKPFGAVQVGCEVRFRIDVYDEPSPVSHLRLWIEDQGEVLIPMKQIDSPHPEFLRFEAEYTPTTTGLVWYSFHIQASDGAVWKYGARREGIGGEGSFHFGEPPSFQLTVYAQNRTDLPSWYTNGVMYQIFPDRFCRSEQSSARVEAIFKEEREQGRKGPVRRFQPDWDFPVNYEKTPDGRIAAWDFYGGDLWGIVEKIPYLKDLGVSVLYLNPIFCAASNHRYDTANYFEIDPLLGGQEAFDALVDALHKNEMYLVLDGVFNHVGADSPYMNRYGNYPNTGAYQSSDSPYESWFSRKEDGTFEAWWGIDDLPSIVPNNPEFTELICGENGVIRHWLRQGADGWRLDVADELSDEFIQRIKTAALAEKPDALLLGEVWEDASNKVSYGVRRKYFEGSELDGVMNYPLREALLGWLRQETSAQDLADVVMSLQEHYPHDAFLSNMNLLGSHDRPRLFTLLGGRPHQDCLSDSERKQARLSPEQEGLATSRLWVASLVQMLLPGVPSIYYGDEQGLQGYSDPYCRGTFRCDGGNANCYTIYRNALGIRKSDALFVEGTLQAFAPNRDVFAFWRTGENDICALVLANASTTQSYHQRIKLPKDLFEKIQAKELVVGDIVSGREVRVHADTREIEVFLWPLGTSVVYFNKPLSLTKELVPGLGMFAHVTSLVSKAQQETEGCFGKTVISVVDDMAKAGISYWQILPLNPTDQFGSPYAGQSAFAGNLALLGNTDNLVKSKKFASSPSFDDFVQTNKHWLYDYVAFRVLKQYFGEENSWTSWPNKYQCYTPDLVQVVRADKRFKDAFDKELCLQFEWERVWSQLKAHTNAKGISIIGDMPMYVSFDSSDVWAHQELFDLNEHHKPLFEAGAPADNFSQDGQKWGNPTYCWKQHKNTNYCWWLQRFERAFSLYDVVRLDHFIGFSSFFKIEEHKPAKDGTFSFGPGLELFEVAFKKFGSLPIIAEDLGMLTPANRLLVQQVGALGMDVVQFKDCDPMTEFKPKNGCILYTSTHDTQTLFGWCLNRYGVDRAKECAEMLMKKAVRSKDTVRIVSIQDVLGLSDDCRMNTPGVAEGNWQWRATQVQIEVSLAKLKVLNV